jgi:hypothetical protein
MPQYVLLDPTKHQTVKIKKHADFAFAQKQHHSALVVHEFASAASSFPIVLMKDNETGQFRSVAMFSLISGENSFYNKDEWQGVHVPYAFLRHPFELGPDPEQDKTLTLYLDEKSEYLSDTHGEALYADNQASLFLQSVQSKMAEYYQQERLSHDFIQCLLGLNLLKEIELLVDYSDSKKNRIKGIYTIDEEALRQLSDESVLALNKQNYLLPIHAMLSSLSQINRLIKLHNKHAEPKINGVQMRVNAEEM